MTETEGCRVCGVSEIPHRAAEMTGDTKHQFSTDGSLKAVDPQSRARQQRQSQPILVVGAIDTGLRKLLLDKGILTNEDFATLLSPGPGDEGDRGTGETQSPE